MSGKNDIRKKYTGMKAVKKLAKEIEERVTERIVGLRLIALENGAEEYLRIFGRGISAAKCAALAVACEAHAGNGIGG